MKCHECIFCVKDCRNTPYRRDTQYFCRQKGAFFSRSHRPGEGARILPTDAACERFSPVTISNEEQP